MIRLAARSSARGPTSSREHTDCINGAAWSPDGSRIATCSLDRTVRLFDPSAGLITVLPCDSLVILVARSPDGHRLAAVSRMGQLFVWDATAGTP